MKKNLKRNLVAAAGAATVLSLAFASPSLAHSKSQTSTTSTSTTKAAHADKMGAFGKLAATVTGVPTTVTDARSASRGAYFTVYTLDAAATAVPTTQPTTGGVRLEVRGGTLATATLTGDIPLKAGAASTTTNYAIYPSTGGTAVFATVTVDAAGVATVTSSAALTATYDATIAAAAPVAGPGKGEGKGQGKMGDGRGKGKGPKGQKDGVAKAGVSASVTVPADGKTYSIKVTETAEKGVAVATPVARPAIALTGTGAQTVKLGLGASDTYKIELVAADGTVVSTVTVTVAADGTVATPIVLG